MKRLLSGIVLAMAALMMGLCACGSSTASSESPAAESSTSAAASSPAAEPANEADAAATTPTAGLDRDGLKEYLEGLDESFAGPPSAYQFTLEGESYELPCSVSEFLDNGWSLELPEEFSGSYLKLPDGLPGSDEYASFDVFTGKKRFTLSVVANGASDWKDCTIIAIEYKPEDRADRAVDFELASGVGQSPTADDVLAVYGKPFIPGISERNGAIFISSLSYSYTGAAQEAERIAQEEERKARAESDGKVHVTSSPVSAAGGTIFSLRNNYDTLAFSFNSDGSLSGIKMLNSL